MTAAKGKLQPPLPPPPAALLPPPPAPLSLLPLPSPLPPPPPHSFVHYSSEIHPETGGILHVQLVTCIHIHTNRTWRAKALAFGGIGVCVWGGGGEGTGGAEGRGGWYCKELADLLRCGLSLYNNTPWPAVWRGCVLVQHHALTCWLWDVLVQKCALTRWLQGVLVQQYALTCWLPWGQRPYTL